MEERVCIYIDGSNLYHGLKGNFQRTDLNFEKLINWLVDGRKLIRTYYYNASIPVKDNPDRAKRQQKFLAGLSKIPYLDIRLGRLEPRGNTFVEKGVDIAIAVDMLSMAFNNVYDTAILVSSDGDFVKAVKAVCDTGKHVEAACFQKAYHIKEAADKCRELTASNLSSLWL